MTIACFSTTDTEYGFLLYYCDIYKFPYFCSQYYCIDCLLQKRKDFLSGIVTVAMETLTHPQETQALQLSDDILMTDDPLTFVNSGTTDTQMYSMPLMVLIVLLSMI